MNSGSPTPSDRLLQALTALALLFTPIFVAVIGYRATSSNTSKDYVSLAVSILNAKDSPKESRAWATAILNDLSPVPVPDALKQQLGSGGGLVTTYVPIATPPVVMDCPTKQQLAKLRSERPKRPAGKRRVEDLNYNEAGLYATEMEAYADATEGIMESCSHMSDDWKKLDSKSGPPSREAAHQ